MEASRDPPGPPSGSAPGPGGAFGAWEQAFPVRLFETDAQGTLGVGGLCDYLQEAAGNHAGTFGVSVTGLRERGLTWVLSRLRLRVERLPGAGETVTVHTWPTGAEKLFALRDFRVLDGAGACIASAVSAWLIIGLAGRRPVRVQSVFDPPDVTRVARSLDVGIEKVPPAEGPGREAPLVVRLTDLDANAHANNARISEWIVESVGREFFLDHGLAGLDVDFLAEAMHGDSLLSRAAPLPGGTFHHSLVRPADGREIARARTLWRARRSRT